VSLLHIQTGIDALNHLALLNPLSSASHFMVDPTLLPEGCMTFGYGYGGGAPLVFTLDKGRDVEVGFLKLFLGTEYVDLSDIEQLSPFSGARGVSRAEISSAVSTWDTVSVTVVLRRGREGTQDDGLEMEESHMKEGEDLSHLRRPSPINLNDQVLQVRLIEMMMCTI